MTNLSMRHRLTHASDAAAKATKLCHRIIHAHFGQTKARRPFPLAQRPHQNFRHKKGHIRDYPHGTFVDYGMHAYDDDVPLATLQDTPPVAT